MKNNRNTFNFFAKYLIGKISVPFKIKVFCSKDPANSSKLFFLSFMPETLRINEMSYSFFNKGDGIILVNLLILLRSRWTFKTGEKMGLQENWEINTLLVCSDTFTPSLPTSPYQMNYITVAPTAILCIKYIVDQQMTLLLNTVWALRGS